MLLACQEDILMCFVYVVQDSSMFANSIPVTLGSVCLNKRLLYHSLFFSRPCVCDLNAYGYLLLLTGKISRNNVCPLLHFLSLEKLIIAHLLKKSY